MALLAETSLAAVGRPDDALAEHSAIVEAIADGNGGVGAVFEEDDDGDVQVSALRLRTQFNDGGETGLEVIQEGAGTGVLILNGSQIDEAIAAEGVEVTQ